MNFAAALDLEIDKAFLKTEIVFLHSSQFLSRSKIIFFREENNFIKK